MIRVKQKGSFDNTQKYFKKALKVSEIDGVTSIAEKTLEKLKQATPMDSGVTRESWRYLIVNKRNSKEIQFINDNVNDGVKIVLLLEFGHVNNNGSWVQGEPFIDDIIRNSYNEILNTTWKEMKRL